jgi:hypothetical protein
MLSILSSPLTHCGRACELPCDELNGDVAWECATCLVELCRAGAPGYPTSTIDGELNPAAAAAVAADLPEAKEYLAQHASSRNESTARACGRRRGELLELRRAAEDAARDWTHDPAATVVDRTTGCVNGWCSFSYGERKNALWKPSSPLILKFGDNTHVLQEYLAILGLCEAQQHRSEDVRRRLPWVGKPFVVRIGNGTRIVVLPEQRLSGTWLRVRDGNTFYNAIWGLRHQASACRAVLKDLLLWEAWIHQTRVMLPDLQLMLSSSGELWMVDPSGLEPIPTRTPGWPRHLVWKPRLHRRPTAFPWDVAVEYDWLRQRLSLLSFALVTALLAEGSPTAAQELLGQHAVCELGCAFHRMPASFRVDPSGDAFTQEATWRLAQLLDAGADAAEMAWHSNRTRGGGCFHGEPTESGEQCAVLGGESFLAHEAMLWCLLASRHPAMQSLCDSSISIGITELCAEGSPCFTLRQAMARALSDGKEDDVRAQVDAALRLHRELYKPFVDYGEPYSDREALLVHVGHQPRSDAGLARWPRPWLAWTGALGFALSAIAGGILVWVRVKRHRSRTTKATTSGSARDRRGMQRGASKIL